MNIQNTKNSKILLYIRNTYEYHLKVETTHNILYSKTFNLEIFKIPKNIPMYDEIIKNLTSIQNTYKCHMKLKILSILIDITSIGNCL